MPIENPHTAEKMAYAEKPYRELEAHARQLGIGHVAAQMSGLANFESEKLANAESEKKPAGFMTANGSLYTYDDTGRTTRHKTATGEQMPRQDITVFAYMTDEESQMFLDAIHATTGDPETDWIARIVERNEDSTVKVVNDINEVSRPDSLYLIVTRGPKVLQHVKASAMPVEGMNVFDMRHYQKGSELRSERHLGNKVVKISY